MKAALLSGADVSDSAIDSLLPMRYRWASETHWTPSMACRRAAEWLVQGPEARVLDVGSGVGKLCLIGSMTTGARFVGVELRPQLVSIAERLAAELGAWSTSFLCGDALALDWREYTSLYFYNPFAESLFPPARRIDASIDCSEEEQGLSMDRVFAKLEELREGTRVVIYHALGCRLPDGFYRARREWSVHSSIELWVRGEGEGLPDEVDPA